MGVVTYTATTSNSTRALIVSLKGQANYQVVFDGVEMREAVASLRTTCWSPCGFDDTSRESTLGSGLEVGVAALGL